MDEKTPKAPRGRGRPALDSTAPTTPITIRLTAPQKEKLGRLGGAPWVRERIDKAKDPEK